MNVDVRKCARCGGNHDEVLFKEFTIPQDDIEYTHYGFCPANYEPILLAVVVDIEICDNCGEHKEGDHLCPHDIPDHLNCLIAECEDPRQYPNGLYCKGHQKEHVENIIKKVAGG